MSGIVNYLERGVVAGVAGGLVFGLYTVAVANPLIEHIERLAHRGHDHGHGHEHTVSELTTTVVSVGSAVLWGIFLGALFGLAFYFLEPSLPGTGVLRTLVLGGAGFLTVSAAPWLVLPPAAPGAEESLGVTPRLLLYGGMMIVGAVVATASIVGYKRTKHRGKIAGFLVAAAPVAALVGVAVTAAPTIVTHPGISGDLVTAFRGVIALSTAGLWAVISGSYHLLHSRTERTRTAAQTDTEEPSVPNAD